MTIRLRNLPATAPVGTMIRFLNFGINHEGVIAEFPRKSTLSGKESARCSCGPRRAANSGYADVVVLGEFVQRSAPRAASGGLLMLRPICCPWALARLLPSAVRVRIRSRSTSARPPSTASIKRPVLVPVSVHGSARERNCRAHDALQAVREQRSLQPVLTLHETFHPAIPQ